MLRRLNARIDADDAMQRPARFAWRRWMSAAAAAAWLAGLRLPEAGRFQSYANHTGDVAVLHLEDGTQVWLQDGTELRYAVGKGDGERIVRLDGEAYFDVSHDARHPFVVETRELAIRVLGTAFNVRALAGDPLTEVVLERGAVRLETPGGDNLVRLHPNQRAGFDAQGEELPLLTQNFGKFPWGGDCIGQKAGVTTADKTVANLSLDNETVSVTAGTNASIGGITSTVRNGNAAFYRAIGMEGWTGYLNYMCPGYIQLGAASDNADGQPGNLISPVLNIPAGYDLLLTCKVAIWAAAPDQGMVGICEKNDGFWIPKGTLDKIVASTKSYVSLDIPAYTWVEVTAVIPNPGAKANLAFFISTADSWFSGSSVKAGRWYIDDIKLVY